MDKDIQWGQGKVCVFLFQRLQTFGCRYQWKMALTQKIACNGSVWIEVCLLFFSQTLSWGGNVQNRNFKVFLFVFLNRATIEEVEGDVCELESKLDKVSPTHGKHCWLLHLSSCVNSQLWRALCVWNMDWMGVYHRVNVLLLEPWLNGGLDFKLRVFD